MDILHRQPKVQQCQWAATVAALLASQLRLYNVNKYERIKQEHRNTYLVVRTHLPGEFQMVMGTPRLGKEGISAIFDPKPICASVTRSKCEHAASQHVDHLPRGARQYTPFPVASEKYIFFVTVQNARALTGRHRVTAYTWAFHVGRALYAKCAQVCSGASRPGTPMPRLPRPQGHPPDHTRAGKKRTATRPWWRGNDDLNRPNSSLATPHFLT